VVGEDDKLSHEGGEGEFFSFATSEEAEVERFEDRIVAGGDGSQGDLFSYTPTIN
jgi:hypothetical protein